MMKLSAPNSEKQILLHCCCAPCSGSIIERMLQSELTPTLYFYNPNIDPKGEYDRRKKEVVRYAEKRGVPFADGDWDQKAWLELTKGHEKDPERAQRCDLCFKMRLKQAAVYARENGFKVFATSLGISRWKDFDQVARAGEAASALFPDLAYWDMNWRKEGGVQMMDKISKDENFYRQDYCGCLYSRSRKSKKPAPKSGRKNSFFRVSRPNGLRSDPLNHPSRTKDGTAA